MEAVRAACGLCRRVQRRSLDAATLQKGDRSPVTVADFGAQAVVSHLLTRCFPNVPLIGEENASTLRVEAHAAVRDRVLEEVRALLPDLGMTEMLSAIDRGSWKGGKQGRFWVLDPIDGTKGFLRGDQYAVALALVEDGKVILGVLGCPDLARTTGSREDEVGCLFVAVRGEGTFECGLEQGDEHPVRVAGDRQPESVRFCESVEKAHSSRSATARIATILGIQRPPLRIDSQCKYAVVARGEAALYLRFPTRTNYLEKVWDHAAGSLLVAEAGGTVSDARGEPLDFSLCLHLENNRGILATNGHLHPRLIEAVGRAFPDPFPPRQT